MSSKNEVTLVGWVESDPKAGETNGKKWAYFRLKTTESYSGKSYDTYHDIMLSGKISDTKLKKGDYIMVNGKITYRPDKKTQTPRASINVFSHIYYLVPLTQQEATPAPAPSAPQYDDSDIPF